MAQDSQLLQSSVDITVPVSELILELPAGFHKHEIIILGLSVDTNGIWLAGAFSTDDGVTYHTTAGDYESATRTSSTPPANNTQEKDDGIHIMAVEGDAGRGLKGDSAQTYNAHLRMEIFDADRTVLDEVDGGRVHAFHQSTHSTNATVPDTDGDQGYTWGPTVFLANALAVTHLRISTSSGNFTGGAILVYGIGEV